MQGRRRGSVEIRRPLLWLGATASFVLIVDQLTKAAVRASLQPNQSFSVVPGLFELARVQNTGAAFGLLPGRREIFIGISLLMILGVGIYYWRERPTQWPVVTALGLVIGGAVGNLLDRALVGRVTDFLAFSFFAPVFNVADSAIVVGVAVLVVWVLFGNEGESVMPEATASDSGVDGDREPAAEEGRSDATREATP